MNVPLRPRPAVRSRPRRIAALLWLSCALAAPASAQSAARAVAAVQLTPVRRFEAHSASSVIAPSAITSDGGGLPHWARWGLVGAAAGAATFPLLGSMASDSKAHPASEAAAGALAGFVIVGGGVALWDSVCGGDTRSRRAGLCGGR